MQLPFRGDVSSSSRCEAAFPKLNNKEAVRPKWRPVVRTYAIALKSKTSVEVACDFR